MKGKSDPPPTAIDAQQAFEFCVEHWITKGRDKEYYDKFYSFPNIIERLINDSLKQTTVSQYLKN